MKKKTQRIISRIILGVLSLYVILCFILPFIAYSDYPKEDFSTSTPTTPIQEETLVTEPPESVTTTPTETPEPTVEPVPTEEPMEEPTEEPEKVVETIPEPEPEPEESRYSEPFPYTEQELDLLSRLVESEGSTESYDTRLKIASVVINRVNDPDFPNTIRGVIYAKNQFSVTVIYKNGIPMIDYPASEDSINAARDVLDNGSILPDDVQVFYAKWCRDPWLNSRVTYGTFDNTVFAYIYGR